MSAAGSQSVGVEAETSAGPRARLRADQPVRAALALGVAAVLAFLGFAYAGGADSYVRINDNLDGLLPLYRVLAEEPVIGGLGDRVEPLMGGLPRNSLLSTLHLGVLPYFVLEPLQALVWNELVIRLVAFGGMFLLLRRRVLPDAPPLLLAGVSVAFALLPFLAGSYLSVAGQPWLVAALLEIRDRRAGVLDWLAVPVFPLYSSLAYVGPFVLAATGILALVASVRARRLHGPLLVAVIAMTLLYLGTEYRLLHQTLLDDSYVSFRAEWDHRDRPFTTAVRSALTMLVTSQHHAPARQLPFVLGASLLALLLHVPRWRQVLRHAPALRRLVGPPSEPAQPSDRLAFLLLAALVGCAAVAPFHALYIWEATQDWIKESGITLFVMFGFHRLQWLHPLLYGIAFALALALLARRGRVGAWVVAALLVAQLGLLVGDSDARRVAHEDGVTYREFYSPALFTEIRDFIGRTPSGYRVASFGLIPGIPLYNGFYTVDGFLSNYPLPYKHRFRQVIAEELEKDAWLRDHYDRWGAHVHLYSTELGMVVGYRRRMLYTRDAPVRSVSDVDFDVRALRDLGAEYVMSAVEIRNHAELGLTLERVFDRPDSPWRIHLYSL